MWIHLINYYPCSSTIINFQLLHSNFNHSHPTSYIFIHLYQFSSLFIHFHGFWSSWSSWLSWLYWSSWSSVTSLTRVTSVKSANQDSMTDSLDHWCKSLLECLVTLKKLRKSNLKTRTFGQIESIRKWKRWTKVFSPVPRNPRCTSFIRVCKDLALGGSSPPSLFSLVSLNSTKSEMRPVLWLQLHLVNEIKSPDNRCKMQRNVPALTFSICQMKSSDQIFIIKLNYLILFQCNTFLLFKEGDNLIWAQAPSCTLE